MCKKWRPPCTGRRITHRPQHMRGWEVPRFPRTTFPRNDGLSVIASPEQIDASRLTDLAFRVGRATLFLFAILLLALLAGTIDCAALRLPADLHAGEMIDLVVGRIFGTLQLTIDDVA